MKRALTSALLVLVVALPSGRVAACRGQSSVVPPGKSRPIKLRLGLVGYLRLPEGYKAFYTGRTVDAWGGYILSADGSLRVEWSAGMVQTPFADGEDKFLWVKRERIGKGRLQYGLRRTDEGEVVAATVGFASFTMPVKSERDVDQFLKLVRGYKMDQCGSDCERPLPAPPSNNGMQRTRN